MAEAPVRRVAVALFEGFTVLDVYGPVQAFASARVARPDGSWHRLFEIITLAEKAGPVKAGEGPTTHADYAFADAPPYDILLIPGGFGTRQAVNNAPLLLALTAASRKAVVTTTVCTGSALLARTGLMDDRPATSNKVAWDWVVQQGPRVRWWREARWVDDGDLVTSSGVSAGIDMALSVVARLHGVDMARQAARFYATGRRKTSTARVFLRLGTGAIQINGRTAEDYFPREILRMHMLEPLRTIDRVGNFDLYVTVKGGGDNGQAGAIRQGLARALEKYDSALRPTLKKAGFLTRDAREKERKKYGQRGARARFQYSKR